MQQSKLGNVSNRLAFLAGLKTVDPICFGMNAKIQVHWMEEALFEKRLLLDSFLNKASRNKVFIIPQ